MKHIITNLIVKVIFSIFFILFTNKPLSAQLNKTSLPFKPSLMTDFQQDTSLVYLKSCLHSNSLLYQQAYQSSLGPICKAENKIAKKNKMNIKMRLGDQKYVDWLEQKN